MEEWAFDLFTKNAKILDNVVSIEWFHTQPYEKNNYTSINGNHQQLDKKLLLPKSIIEIENYNKILKMILTDQIDLKYLDQENLPVEYEQLWNYVCKNMGLNNLLDTENCYNKMFDDFIGSDNHSVETIGSNSGLVNNSKHLSRKTKVNRVSTQVDDSKALNKIIDSMLFINNTVWGVKEFYP